jgi:transposase-like protein
MPGTADVSAPDGSDGEVVADSGRKSMVDFKRPPFEKDIILTRVRRYVACPLSYRQLDELMQERGVSVDHATINRWVLT